MRVCYWSKGSQHLLIGLVYSHYSVFVSGLAGDVSAQLMSGDPPREFCL